MLPTTLIFSTDRESVLRLRSNHDSVPSHTALHDRGFLAQFGYATSVPLQSQLGSVKFLFTPVD